MADLCAPIRVEDAPPARSDSALDMRWILDWPHRERSDLQVATLRAQLAGDFEEHKRLLAEFDEKSDARPYVTLTNAAFFEAVDRRFNSAD